MQAYSCMLCKKSDREFINICYKNGRNSAKDDILEICGNSVAQYLEIDDLICSRCMKILDSAAKLKRQVYEIVLDYGTNRQVSGKPGTKALENSEVPEDSDYEEDSPAVATSPLSTSALRNFRGTSTSPHNYMGTSPDNLLIIKSSIPFDQRSDTDMDEANSKYRYYERDTPLLDREVQRVNFRGRRRHKGHNWTRRKGSQRSRSRSNARSSSHHSRNSRNTAQSRSSRTTTASKKNQIQEQSQKQQKKRILKDFLYQNDALAQFTRAYLNKNADILDEDLNFDVEWNGHSGKPVIKTRFASELRDKLLAEYEQLVYECPFNSCQNIVFTLEEHTEHRVRVHNEMALFWCDQCKFSYITQDDLDKHKEQHSDKFLAYCIYCSEEFTNKRLYEEHLNEHLIHSFPCIYCDRFFLRKQICDIHVREKHPGRKKKIKRLKPQSILDRIDKYPDRREDSTRPESVNTPQEFVVKILCQHGQPEDTSVNTEKDLIDSNGEDLVDSNGEDLVDLNCEDSNNGSLMDICDTGETAVDIISTTN